jgi:hypothetical protein
MGVQAQQVQLESEMKAKQAKYESEILAKTKDWPIVGKTEDDFRKYFDENIVTLDPIEGIWTIQQTGTQRNILSGIYRSMPESNPYRIAIVQDKPFKDFKNFDFVAVILESEYSYWKPGRVKALFRRTAYDYLYDGVWYMANYTKKTGNYIIDELGLIKTTNTSYDPIQTNIELTYETYFIKAYPPFIDRRKITSSEEIRSSGSGFLISKNGLVVTNYHVVENAIKIEIIFPEKQIVKTATVRIKDAKNDIAILALDNFSLAVIGVQKIPFSLANVSSIKVGQEVFTLGFPLSDIMGTKSRLSTGRINSMYGIQDDPRLYQISNPLQPGNSGGPLFNAEGELIGIVVSGLNAIYFYENLGIIPQNVNFGIKVNYLNNLISMLPEGDEILTRKNLVPQTKMVDQIEQLSPFIVQIKVY